MELANEFMKIKPIKAWAIVGKELKIKAIDIFEWRDAKEFKLPKGEKLIQVLINPIEKKTSKSKYNKK